MALREIGTGARGIAVIDDKTTDRDLDAMHQGGVPRHSAESRHRWHQRSRARPFALPTRRRTHEGAWLAHSDLRHIRSHKRHPRPRYRLTRSRCLRSFRRRQDSSRRRATEPAASSNSCAPVRLVEGLGRLPGVRVEKAPTIPTPPHSLRPSSPPTRIASSGVPIGHTLAPPGARR